MRGDKEKSVFEESVVLSAKLIPHDLKKRAAESCHKLRNKKILYCDKVEEVCYFTFRDIFWAIENYESSFTYPAPDETIETFIREMPSIRA